MVCVDRQTVSMQTEEEGCQFWFSVQRCALCMYNCHKCTAYEIIAISKERGRKRKSQCGRCMYCNSWDHMGQRRM